MSKLPLKGGKLGRDSRLKLGGFIERIESQIEEISTSKLHISSVYNEAEKFGFSRRVMGKCLMARKKPETDDSNEHELFTMYMDGLEENSNAK